MVAGRLSLGDMTTTLRVSVFNTIRGSEHISYLDHYRSVSMRSTKGKARHLSVLVIGSRNVQQKIMIHSVYFVVNYMCWRVG